MTAATSITVRVPLTIQKRGGRKVLISPEGVVIPGASRQATTTADPALLKALARAFRWKRTRCVLNLWRHVSARRSEHAFIDRTA